MLQLSFRYNPLFFNYKYKIIIRRKKSVKILIFFFSDTYAFMYRMHNTVVFECRFPNTFRLLSTLKNSVFVVLRSAPTRGGGSGVAYPGPEFSSGPGIRTAKKWFYEMLKNPCLPFIYNLEINIECKQIISKKRSTLSTTSIMKYSISG